MVINMKKLPKHGNIMLCTNKFMAALKSMGCDIYIHTYTVFFS